MSQAITNTIPKTLTGLLGLSLPKSTTQTTTPSSIPSQTATKPTPSLFMGGTKPASSAFGNQPNFESISGAKSYVPPPVTGPTYTANGVIPSAFTTLGTSGTTPNSGGTAPVGQTVASSMPSSGGVNNIQSNNQNSVIPTNTPTPPVRGLFPSVLSSLANSSIKNDALATNAAKIAADAGKQISDIGGQGARLEAGQLTTGTTPVASGNAAITAQTTAAQQQAIAEGAGVALQGNQQGIAAQGQTQSALSSAAGYSKPSVESYGQTSYDPVSNTFSGGGSLPPEVMQQYAQMAATGQYSAIPSFITSNPVLNAQLNVAAKAFNPNYTPIGASGASSVLQGIPALQSASTAAEGIKNTIQSYLQSNPQLNPSDLVAGNKISQWLQSGQFGDPKYQTLGAYLSEYVSTLAPILGVGGDTTNLKTQIAQGMVNAAASGQSISEVLNNIGTLAAHKITDLQSGATGGNTTVPSASSSDGGFSETW